VAKMVRKQIYLFPAQNLALRRLAKERGVSEAEVIRQALERELAVEATAGRDSEAAWASILQFIRSRRSSGAALQWNRQELYEERESI